MATKLIALHNCFLVHLYIDNINNSLRTKHLIFHCLPFSFFFLILGAAISSCTDFNFCRDEHGQHDHESYYGDRDTESLVAVSSGPSFSCNDFEFYNALLIYCMKRGSNHLVISFGVSHSVLNIK